MLFWLCVTANSEIPADRVHRAISTCLDLLDIIRKTDLVSAQVQEKLFQSWRYMKRLEEPNPSTGRFPLLTAVVTDMDLEDEGGLTWFGYRGLKWDVEIQHLIPG